MNTRFMMKAETLNNKKPIAAGYLVLILIGVILIFLLMLEIRHPYFFLQDDNRDTYLPNFVHAYRSLANGELALYNFHQFSGNPALAGGQNGELYPLVYLAVFLSNIFFGHVFATIDILVIIYLMLGGAGVFFLIDFLANDRRAAFFAGIAWPLSSFVVYGSNSWNIIAALAAYFPWMIYFSLRTFENRRLRWFALGIVARLSLFYVGHIQYFVYAVIFEFFVGISYALYVSTSGAKRKNATRFILEFLAGYMIVFLLALPLLWPMWNYTSHSAFRDDKLSIVKFIQLFYPIDQLLLSLVFPFKAISPPLWGRDLNFSSISHIGYIPIILIGTGIYLKFKHKAAPLSVNGTRFAVFVRPLLLALIWATVPFFSILLYFVPVVNRFRWPFKIAFFLDFFLVILAALTLAYLLKNFRFFARNSIPIILGLIIIQLFNYGLLYMATPYKDFGGHHADTIPLQEPFKEELSEGRIVAVGFDVWKQADYGTTPENTSPTLGFNYATLWGLDYFAGYDILISDDKRTATLDMNIRAIWSLNKAVPVVQFRDAGVSWYIIPQSKYEKYAKELAPYGIVKKYEDSYRALMFDPFAKPMVYWLDDGAPIKDVHETVNTIRVGTDDADGGRIVFNYSYSEFFIASVDGIPTEVSRFGINNFAIEVGPGKHKILIEYQDPYFIKGLKIAAATLIMLIAMVVIRAVIGDRRRTRTRIPERR